MSILSPRRNLIIEPGRVSVAFVKRETYTSILPFYSFCISLSLFLPPVLFGPFPVDALSTDNSAFIAKRRSQICRRRCSSSFFSSTTIRLSHSPRVYSVECADAHISAFAARMSFEYNGRFPDEIVSVRSPLARIMGA